MGEEMVRATGYCIGRIIVARVYSRTFVQSLLGVCVAAFVGATGVYAEHRSTQDSSTFAFRACEGSVTRPGHVSSWLPKVKAILLGYGKEVALFKDDSTRSVGNGYLERAVKLISNPVDHMHGRCWYDDQLSCSMLVSSLEEIVVFLRTLSKLDVNSSIAALIHDTRIVAKGLNDSCQRLPWHLG